MSSPRVRVTDPQAVASTWWGRVVAHVELTKPRIVELLLVTTVPAMIVAEQGWPGIGLVAATLIGGSLSAGGANALNNVADRDIDEMMRRTHHRPLPTERVEPRSALALGLTLGTLGFVSLWLAVNPTAALLATGALLFYVLVYTLYLKRRTPQNIVIGGAAGAVPVLVGWAAVTGTLELPALVLFGIVFLWTPPHFWALAVRYRSDYERAGVPMLPVVAGERRTTNQILGYSVATVAVSLLLYPVAPMGWVYLGCACVLGALFVVGALDVRRRPEIAMRYFHFSVVYLTLLFAAMGIDRLLL